MTDWHDEAELEEWEYPEPDTQDSGELDLICCPSCGRDVLDEAVQCPHCGDYIVHSHRPMAAATKLGWFGVLIAVALILIVLIAFA